MHTQYSPSYSLTIRCFSYFPHNTEIIYAWYIRRRVKCNAERGRVLFLCFPTKEVATRVYRHGEISTTKEMISATRHDVSGWALLWCCNAGAGSNGGSSDFLSCHVRASVSRAKITGRRTPASQLSATISTGYTRNTRYPSLPLSSSTRPTQRRVRRCVTNTRRESPPQRVCIHGGIGICNSLRASLATPGRSSAHLFIFNFDAPTCRCSR